MKHARRMRIVESLKRIPSERLSWLWLAVGFLLLPFTAWQTVVPIAGWLAPVFLLRFARTASRSWPSRVLIFVAYAGATMIASRGAPFNPLGFLGNVLIKGWVWALPYAADRLLARRLEGWVRSLIFPLAFVTVEWALSRSSITSSGSPAYSQAGNLVLMQLLSITGPWGITFLITWFASVINELWERHFQWRSLRGLLGTFAGLLAVTLVFGTLRLNLPARPSETVAAAAVTIDSRTAKDAIESIDWSAANWSTDAQRTALRPKLDPTVDRILANTETALRRGARIVGWQESSAWVLEEDKPEVLGRAAALARQYDAYVQVSLEVLTRTSRLPVLRNESILIDSEGRQLWTYDKTHPVPYDEAFATIPGPGRLPLVDTPHGRLSTAICYDTYFPALIRQAGRGGVDILFAPANDIPSFAESALAIATYRAVEDGVSILRPTGNGVSAVIDCRGRVLARQDSFADHTGVMIAGLPTRGVRTIYSRTGDTFAYLGAAGLVSLAAWVLLRRRTPTTTAEKLEVPASRRGRGTDPADYRGPLAPTSSPRRPGTSSA